MKLKVQFYLDTFREKLIEVPDNWNDLPKCECHLDSGLFRHHRCYRGQLIESLVGKGEIITCKKDE